MNTPYKDIPLPGEKLEYGNLSVEFLVDEYLEVTTAESSAANLTKAESVAPISPQLTETPDR